MVNLAPKKKINDKILINHLKSYCNKLKYTGCLFLLFSFFKKKKKKGKKKKKRGYLNTGVWFQLVMNILQGCR